MMMKEIIGLNNGSSDPFGIIFQVIYFNQILTILQFEFFVHTWQILSGWESIIDNI